MNSTILKRNLSDAACTKVLADIYGAEQVDFQVARYGKAIDCYEEHFGEGEIAIYSAPGRTEIGGNHTDHQRGMVLAASIDLDAIAVVSCREDNSIHIVSEGYEPITISLENLDKQDAEEGTTTALIKGIADGFLKQGYQIGAFNAYITSNVLNGAGLSSSAAFETLIGTIFSGLYNNMEVSPVTIAMLGQYAENVYFGKPCGLMDQMACSVGSLVHIDFLDAKNPIINRIEYNIEEQGYRLCIVDTKGSHADLTPDYAAIPGEMRSVAAYFGKEVLTQVEEDKFYAEIPNLRASLSDRAILRAIHFYSENRRVQQEVDALKNNNFAEFLEIFTKSAKSSYQYLQNVYSSLDFNNQAIPLALALSESILGDNGVCRVHGGGFAGTIQVFVKASYVAEYKKAIEAYMGEGSCHILQIRAFGGTKVFA